MIYFFYRLIKKCAGISLKREGKTKKRADVFKETPARLILSIV
jgi:hypothetical protein